MDASGIHLPPPKQLADALGLRGRDDRRGAVFSRRRLGQCFLANRTTLDKIVRSARLEPEMPVIEIGAGPGYLTARIRRQAARLVAIEIDERFRPLHERCFAGLEPPVEFIYADVLRLDWPALLDRIGGAPYVVMGNIPYRITSPLLDLLLGLSPPAERIVLLVQREFAQRLAARPGSRAYGALTAKTALSASVRQALFVPRHCFQPRPRVDSAVVVIEPRRPPMVDPTRLEKVFSVIDAAFAQRRKKLVNSLLGSGRLGEDHDLIVGFLEKAGIDPARRAETLAPEEFVALAAAVPSSFHTSSRVGEKKAANSAQSPPAERGTCEKRDF